MGLVTRWALSSERRAWASLVVLTLLTRVPVLIHPEAIDDEETYGVVAREMVQGGRMYVDAIERKPPLLFWTYEGIFRAFGVYDWLAVHAVSVAWTLLTMLGLYLAARSRFGWRAGGAAALLYGLYSPWLESKNLALNGELLMNLPLAWALWLVLRRRTAMAAVELAVAGGLVALAFLLKQPAAIAGVAFAVYTLTPSYRAARGIGLRDSIVRAAALAAGAAVVVGCAVVILRAQGIFDEAYYWTIRDHDVPHGPLDPAFWLKSLMTLAFVAVCAPLVACAAIAVRRGLSPNGALEPERDAIVGLVLLTGASAIGTAASGRFYSHYYLQLVPPLAVLGAPVLASVLGGDDPLSARTRVLRARPVAAWLALTAITFTVLHGWDLARHRGLMEAARYVRAHSSPGERIFVWGQLAGLYVDSDRRPASRYIATFALTGYVFGSPRSWDPTFDTTDRIVPGAWDNLARDLERHPPAFILDVDAARDVPRYPIERFAVLRDLVHERYVEVARTREAIVYARR